MFKDLRKIISFILLVVLSISLIRPQSVMAWGKMENLSPLDSDVNVLAEGNVYSSGFSCISFNNIRYWDENTNSIKETKDKFIKSITFNGRKLDELSGDFERLQGSSHININISGMYSNMDILISSLDVEEYSDYVDISINTTVSKHINYETSLDIGDTFVGGSTYAFLYSEVHNVCGDVTYVTNKEQTYMGYGSVYDNYPSLGNIYFNNIDYTNINNEEFNYGYNSLGSPYLYFTSNIATYGSKEHTNQIHNYIVDDYINGNTSISYTSIPNANLIYIKFPLGSTWVLTSTKFDATTGKPSYYFTSYQDTKRVCVRFEDGNIGDLVSTDEKNIGYKYDNYSNCYYSDYFYSTSQDIVLSNGNSTIDLANLTVDENGNTSYNILNDLGYTNIGTFNNPSNKNGLNLYFGNEPFELEPTTTVCIIGIENLFYYNSLGEEVPFEEKLENINEFSPDGGYYSYDVSLYYYANIRDDVDAIYYKESDGSIHKFIDIDFNSGTLKKDYTLYDSSLNTDVFENRFNPDGLNLIVENSNSMHKEDLNKVCIKFEEGYIDNNLYYWSGEGSTYRNFIWLPDKEYYVGYFWNDSHDVFIGGVNSNTSEIFIKADLNYFSNDTYDYTIGDYVYNNYATIQEFSNSYNPDGLNLYLGQKIVPVLGIKFRHNRGGTELPNDFYLKDSADTNYSNFIDKTSTDGFYYIAIPHGSYQIYESYYNLGDVKFDKNEKTFVGYSQKYNVSIVDNPNNPDGMNLFFDTPQLQDTLCVKFNTKQGTDMPQDFELRDSYNSIYSFDADDFTFVKDYYKLDLNSYCNDTYGRYDVYEGNMLGTIQFKDGNYNTQNSFTPSGDCIYLVSEFENPDNPLGLNLLFEEVDGTHVSFRVFNKDKNFNKYAYIKLDSDLYSLTIPYINNYNEYFLSSSLPDGMYSITIDGYSVGDLSISGDVIDFIEYKGNSRYYHTIHDPWVSTSPSSYCIDFNDLGINNLYIRVVDVNGNILDNTQVVPKLSDNVKDYICDNYFSYYKYKCFQKALPDGQYTVYVNSDVAGTIELEKSTGKKEYTELTSGKKYSMGTFEATLSGPDDLCLLLTELDWGTKVDIKVSDRDGNPLDSVAVKLTDGVNEYIYQNYDSTNKYYYCNEKIPDGTYTIYVDTDIAGTVELNKDSGKKEFTEVQTDKKYIGSEFTNQDNLDGMNLELTQVDNTTEVTIKVLDYKLDSLENAEVKIANDNNEYLYTGYDTTEECYTSTVEIPNGEYSVYINGELACTVELHKANGIKDYDDNTPNKSYTASEYNNNTTDDKALDLCLTQVSTDVAVKIERHDGGAMYCGDSIELSNNNYTFQLNYSSTDELYKSSTGIPNGEYSLNVKGKSAGTLVLEKGNSTKDFTDSITDTRFTSSTFTNSSSPDGANILLTQLTAEVTVIHKDIEGNELSRSVSDVGVGDTEVFSALVSSEYDVIGSSTKSVTVENTDDIVIYFNYKPKGPTDNYTEVTIIDKYDGLEHIREVGTLVIDGTINPFEPLPELIDNGYQMKDEPADDLVIQGSEMTLVFDYVGPREIKVIDRYDGSDHVRLIETLLDETTYSYKDLTQIDTTFNSYRVKGDSTITGIVTYEDKEIIFEYEKIDTPNTKPQQPVPTPPSKPDEPKYNIRVYDRFNGIDVLRYVHTYDKGDYYTYSALTSDDIKLEGDWVVDGDTSFEGYVTHDMDIVFKYKTLPEETPSEPEETPSEPETGDVSIPYVLMIFISFAVLAFTNKRKK